MTFRDFVVHILFFQPSEGTLNFLVVIIALNLKLLLGFAYFFSEMKIIRGETFNGLLRCSAAT